MSPRGTGLFPLRPASHIKMLHHNDYCAERMHSVLRLEAARRSGAVITQLSRRTQITSESHCSG